MEYLVGGFVSISAALVAFRFYNKRFVWGHYSDLLPDRNVRNADDIRGRTIIITGANSGIGKEVARELYRYGARIIMACRNADECQKAIAEIESSSTPVNVNSDESRLVESGCGELIYKHLDLSSFDSVRLFVERITCEESQIHMLINNAAVYGEPLQITKDGFERNMQVNHLSSALLTLSLLPKLYKQNDSENKTQISSNKIIFVTSALYKNGKIFDGFFRSFTSNDQLKSSPNFASYSKNIYPNTKLANLYFAQELSLKKDLIRNIQVSVASPGFAFTRLHRNVSKSRLLFMSLLTPIIFPILRSSRDGAQTIIGCALMPETKPNIFYHNCKADWKLTFKDPSQGENVFKRTMDSLEPYLKQ